MGEVVCIVCRQVAQSITSVSSEQSAAMQWMRSLSLQLSSCLMTLSGLFRDAHVQTSLLCPRLLTCSAWELCSNHCR